MERVFQVLAVILAGVAAFFLWRGSADSAFFVAVLGGVSFFLSFRFQVKERLREREAERLAAEEAAEVAAEVEADEEGARQLAGYSAEAEWAAGARPERKEPTGD